MNLNILYFDFAVSKIIPIFVVFKSYCGINPQVKRPAIFISGHIEIIEKIFIQILRRVVE